MANPTSFKRKLRSESGEDNPRRTQPGAEVFVMDDLVQGVIGGVDFVQGNTPHWPDLFHQAG